MKLKTEQHNGTCGHCKSSVPIDATVCTGCGAEWGLRNGFSRQKHYDSYIGGYKLSKFIFIISLLTSLTWYFTPPGFFGEFTLAVMALGVLGTLWGLVKMLDMKQGLNAAKSADVSWWR